MGDLDFWIQGIHHGGLAGSAFILLCFYMCVCVCVCVCMLLSFKKTSCDSISVNETGTVVCETILHISLHLIASFNYLSKVHTQISIHELMKYCSYRGVL